MATKTAKKKSKTTTKAAKTKSTKARARATDDAKIVGVGKNPFREGSSRHDQLALAIKSGTVGKFVKAGGSRAYLSWYVRNGHCKVA